MWSGLATIGAAVWPLLKWLVPWAGPRFNVILAVVVAVGGFFLWDHVSDQREINAAVRKAEARVNAEWRQSLDAERKQHDREVARAREAADSIPPTPERPDDLERLCRSDPACRGVD